MNYLQNHIWCSRSNWDGQRYDCKHLVSIPSGGFTGTDDWVALVDEEAEEWFDQEQYEMIRPGWVERVGEEPSSDLFTRKVVNLKPEVLEWLNINVEDRPKSCGEDCLKGWCIGDTTYRATDGSSFTVFFHRKSDAMAFIKRWSKWKKPVHYCQYFSDVRKKLNLETGKYEES